MSFGAGESSRLSLHSSTVERPAVEDLSDLTRGAGGMTDNQLAVTGRFPVRIWVGGLSNLSITVLSLTHQWSGDA